LKATNTDLWTKLAKSKEELGSLNRESGRYSDAADNYRKASSIWQLLAIQYPDVKEYQARLAATEEHRKDLMDHGAAKNPGVTKPRRENE
jgi:hypothetical protein